MRRFALWHIMDPVVREDANHPLLFRRRALHR